jgi:tetratricopeptide (TPR) repeat protein
MRITDLKFLMVAFVMFFATLAIAQTGEEITNAIKREDYTNAEALCKQWMTKDPKSSEPYFYLGEMYYEQDKSALASEQYTKGLTINEDSWLCMIGQAKLLLDAKRDADAQKMFDKVLRKTRSKNAFAYSQIGKAYITCTNPNGDKAIENLTRSLEIDSKVSTYYTLMGDAYLVKGENGKAVSQYEFASDKNKKDPENYVKRGRLWKNGKGYVEAEKALNECLAIDPNYAPAIKELSEVYAKSGQRAKVIPLLKKYNELVGNDYDARMRYVRYLCTFADDFENANAEILKLQEKKPDDAESFRWLAWINTKMGLKAKDDKADAAKIAEYFKKGMDFSKMFLDKKGTRKVYLSDFDNYMTSALENKDFATAEAVLPMILKLDSTKTESYDKIAKGYYDAKIYDKAITAYETKMAKGKPSAVDYSYVGLANLNLKKYTEADAAFGKAADLNPKYLYAYAQRAKIAESYLDRELNTGAAKPFHEKIIEFGAADAVKNKKELFNAYKYLGYYNVKLASDNPAALMYFKKAAEFEAADESVNKAITDLQAAGVIPKAN